MIVTVVVVTVVVTVVATVAVLWQTVAVSMLYVFAWAVTVTVAFTAPWKLLSPWQHLRRGH